MQIDKYTEQRANALHPKLRAEVIQTANELAEKGLIFRIVQGFRSIAEQNAIYAQGRTIPGKIITNAKGGQSYHNYGLAIDFAIDILDSNGNVTSVSFDTNVDSDHDGNKDFMEVINAFGLKGWQSGMFWKFKDTDHLEKTFGLSFQQLADLVSKGKVDSQGYVLF